MPISFLSLAALGLAFVQSADTPEAKAKAMADPPPSVSTSATDKEKARADSGPEKPKGPPRVEQATFGEGCFWSTEAVYERIPGVKSVVSGFSGGAVPNPSYQMVCTGQTGHAEAVQITYDPDVVSYEDLLKVFWASHDPTTPNAQGDDFGPQYRSVIFFHDDAQRKAALKSAKDLAANRRYRNSIVTQLVPMVAFFPAEPYHQDYFRNHPFDQYSESYIIPKLKKLHLLGTGNGNATSHRATTKGAATKREAPKAEATGGTTGH